MHPAASAGATLQTIWFSGQFHGVIRAATPIGSRDDQGRSVAAGECIGFQRLDRRLEMHPSGPDLGVAGEGERRAHLARHRFGEILGAGVVAIENPPQKCEALVPRGPPEAFEGQAGGRNRAVDVSR